jgi:lipopolysaccharide export system protein LptA
MEQQLRAIAHVTGEGLPMVYKMAGMAGFLVLGCIATVGGADNEYLSHKEQFPPEIWASRPLQASSDFLSLAQGSDQPMEITSRGVNVRSIPNGKEVTFEGNVTVKRGDVTLSCDRLVIVYDEKTVDKTGEGKVKKLSKGQKNVSQIKSITASGNVKIVQNERMAIANEALYDNLKGIIRLKGGNPMLRDESGVQIGDPIFINLDEYGSDMPVKYGPIPHQHRK